MFDLESQNDHLKQELKQSLIKLNKVVSVFKESESNTEDSFYLENEDKSFKSRFYEEELDKMCKMIIFEL